MSDEKQYDDPWATGAEEPPVDAVPEDAFDGDEFDIFDDLDLEETESGEAITVRDGSSKKYDDPRDVGLEDGMWVPVRILAAEVQEKHVPRLSSKTCVAKKNGKVVAVLADQVEKAIKEGAEEVIDEFPLPYFVCTANHVAPAFGERRWDWEIEVPVFTIKTALFKPQRNRTGYPNEIGRSLRTATGASAAGDKISKANMHEVAEKMVGEIVMAKINVVQAKKARYRSRLDADNNEIMVQVNPESGDPVTVFRQDEDSSYVIEPSGEIWDGDEGLLVGIEPNRYAIRDNSDLAAPLTEQYFPFNDYIDRNTPFLPLPERTVTVERVDGEVVEGQITLDTIGAVARGNGAGAQVDVLLRNGEVVTAVWFGTEWVEKAQPKMGEDSGMEVFASTDDQKDAEQGAILASM